MTNEEKIVMVFTDGLSRSIPQYEDLEVVKKDLLLLKKNKKGTKQ